MSSYLEYWNLNSSPTIRSAGAVALPPEAFIYVRKDVSAPPLHQAPMAPSPHGPTFLRCPTQDPDGHYPKFSVAANGDEDTKLFPVYAKDADSRAAWVGPRHYTEQHRLVCVLPGHRASVVICQSPS